MAEPTGAKAMENLIQKPRELLRHTPNGISALAAAAFLLLLTLMSGNLVHAQTAAQQQTQPVKPAAATPATAAPKRAAEEPATHKRATVHRAAAHAAKPAAGVPATLPVPPRPAWPAEQPPNSATVTWDSHGLAIEASNSSLDQILHDVVAETGVKLQGLNQDERIFGTYGPGPAREVLSHLLDGSGYNVMMIGGRGDAPPQQIILTKSAAGTPQPPNVQSNNDEDNDADDQSPPTTDTAPVMPFRNPAGEGGPPDRSPQAMQQQMLMHQQQIEQQREMQQQQQPPQSNPQY